MATETVTTPSSKRPRPADFSSKSDSHHEGLLPFDDDTVTVTRRTPKSPRPPLAPREANYTNPPPVIKNPLGILEAKRVLDEKNALIFQLRLQIDELKRALKKVPRDTREAVQNFEEMKRQYETAQLTITDLRFRVADLNAELSDLREDENDAEALAKLVGELEKKLESAQQELKQRDADMTEVCQELDGLRQENLETAANLASRPKEDKKLRIQLVDALRNASRFQTDTDRLRNERQELFNTLTEERAAAKADQIKLRDENAALKREVEQQRLKIQALEQDAGMARSAGSALEEAHTRIQESERARYTKLESDYQNKVEEITQLRDKLTATVSDLQSQVAELSGKVISERQATQAAVSERDAAVTQLKPELARAQARVKELEYQIELLKDQAQAERERLEAQTTERAQSRESQYSSKLQQAETELEAKQNEAAALAATVKRLEAAAKERMLSYTDETKQLKSQVADEYEKRNTAEAELGNLQREHEALMRSHKNLQERQRQLEQEASDLQIANRRAINDAKAIEADKLRLQLKLESIEGRPLSAGERAGYEEVKLAYEALKTESARQRQEWERTYNAFRDESKAAESKIGDLQRQVDNYAATDQKRLQEQSWRIEASLKEAWEREQSRLLGELNTLGADLSRARQLQAETGRQLEDAMRQVVARQTSIAEHELAQARFRDQLNELEQTLVVRDNEIRSLREQTAHYAAKISSLQTQVSEALQKAQRAELQSDQVELSRQELLKRLDQTVSEAATKMESLQLNATQRAASAAENGTAAAEAQFARQVEELKARYERKLAAQKRRLVQSAEDTETQLVKEVVKVQKAFDCTLQFSTELEREQTQSLADLRFIKEFARYSDEKCSRSPPRRTFAGVAALVHAAVRMRRYRRDRVSPGTTRKYREMLNKHLDRQ